MVLLEAVLVCKACEKMLGDQNGHNIHMNLSFPYVNKYEANHKPVSNMQEKKSKFCVRQ